MKTVNFKFSGIYFLTIFILLFSFRSYSQNIPIWFSAYKIKFTSISLPNDTLTYIKSDNETYKFVFYDKTGKCYCEKYLNGKLSEKGNFTSTENPSEILLSARSSTGKTKPSRKAEWYLPIKNGEWQVFKDDVLIKTEIYVMGVLQN